MRRSFISLVVASLATLVALTGFGSADYGTSDTRITGASYVVQAGDTLTSIADRAGVALSDLTRANALADPNLILIGQVLTIPGRPVAVPRAAPSQPTGPGAVRRLTTASLDPACHAPSAAMAEAYSTYEPTASLPRLLRHRPRRLALRPCFEAWSAAYGVPAGLVEGLAWEESGWQNDVVSSANAYGIGQLTGPTIDFISTYLIGSPMDPAIPDQNIRMTVRFVGYLLGQTGGNVSEAVAAYYQGLESVREDGLLPDTAQYVKDVRYLAQLFGYQPASPR